MNNLYQEIQTGIQYLPIKDKILAEKYLQQRNFEFLQELVDSCLIKIRKNKHSKNKKEEYKNIHRDAIEKLSLNIIEYSSYLNFF